MQSIKTVRLAIVTAIVLLAFAACSDLNKPNAGKTSPPSPVEEDLAAQSKVTPPEENDGVIAIKQSIINASLASDEPILEYHGEGVVEGVECYMYSEYVLMEQDDGTQVHRAHRRVGEFAIAKSGERYWYSGDGTDWWEADGTATFGYGDVEPPHFTRESEFVAYIQKDEGLFGESLYSGVDCYYKPENVPDTFTFAYICPQNIHISWEYNYPDSVATWGYLGWTYAKNGQENLEFSIENEGMSKLGDTGYYYSIIPAEDNPDMGAIFSVRWVMDDYLFHMNIPADYVIQDGQPDMDSVMKYIRLQKVEILSGNIIAGRHDAVTSIN